jgi:hypothetical protein
MGGFKGVIIAGIEVEREMLAFMGSLSQNDEHEI